MQRIKINHEGINLEVKFYYQPGDEPSHHYPGGDEVCEIEAIYYKGVDVFEIYVKNGLIEEVEDILRKIVSA